MSDKNFYGYDPDEYPDTELKVYGMEKYEAQVLFDIYERFPDGIMALLELAWMRGYHAASVLGVGEVRNPFIHPDKKKPVDTEAEKD